MSEKRYMHEQLMHLKDPFISEETIEKIELNFLGQQDEENGKERVSEDYVPPASQDNNETNPPLDFYEINKGLFNNDESMKNQREKDPLLFFKQSALKLEKPTTSIKSFCYLPSDPSTFAIISAASKFFKKEDLQLKEPISLRTYQHLTILRLANYISILRMFTKIDKSDQMYQQVKTRLNHIQKLSQHLGLCDDTIQKSDNPYTQMFYNLSLNQPIHQIDRDKKNMQETVGILYDQYFQGYNDFEDENYTQNLLNEERKWVVRSKWIEEVLSNFKNSKQEDVKCWINWLEAQLSSLSDLDVLVNYQNNAAKKPQSIFYLHEFLEQQINLSKREAEDEDEDTYSDDQQVDLIRESIYPRVQFTSEDIKNDHNVVYNYQNVREKLCLKILAREAETDYFLTVFKRKNFGNEKIYEKRINTQGKVLNFKQFEFAPNGKFLYVSFKQKTLNPKNEVDAEKEEEDNPDQDNEYNYDDEKSYNNDQEEERKMEENNKYLSIDLIFPIFSQHKNPLLCKPGNSVLDFHGERTFISFQRVSLPEQQPSNALIEVEGEKQQNRLRVYEHDLYQYQNIKAQDLPESFKSYELGYVPRGRFGKNREGYYIIKNVDKTDEVQFILCKSKEEISLEGNEKIKKSKYPEHFCLNERGDKLLMINETNSKFTISKYNLEAKKGQAKVFRHETNQKYTQIQNLLEGQETENQSVNFKIISVAQDFLIMVHLATKNDEVSIFLGDKQLCQVKDSNIEHFSFLIQEGIVKKIFRKRLFNNQFTFEEDKLEKAFTQDYLDQYPGGNNQQTFQSNNKKSGFNFEYISYDQMEYQLKDFDQQNPQTQKKEWSTQYYKTINRDISFCYPYMFFIYNHDQLYMKDLRLSQNQGYFYLNNYFGIESNMRPLTVQCYQNNNSLTLNVPLIDSSYSSNEFQLRITSIVTFCSMSDPFSLTNTYLQYDMYGFNENVMIKAGAWARIITDSEGKLENDIRFSLNQNCLVIEKWERNTVFSRVLMTQYDSQISKEARNVTDLKSNAGETLGFLQKSYRLLIFQNKEQLQVFSYNLDKHWYPFDFSNPEALEPIFTIQDDELQNPFYNIMIDTLVKGQIDLYILHQNAQMKRLTALIPTDQDNANQLSFIEHPYIYQVDRVFTAKTTKKINLNMQKGQIINYFIANQVLYSSQYDPIDLRAEIFTQDQKMQLGFDISLPFNKSLSSVQFINVSLSDGKVLIQLNENNQQSNEQLIDKLVSLPFINSRVIAQFHHSQFNHPIVPLVSMKGGYTSVFTLNLENTMQYDMFDIYNAVISERYPVHKLMGHENSQYSSYGYKSNLQPGIFVKYFNGIEERIPLDDKFINVERFVISKDGHNILITGHRITVYQDKKEVSMDSGLFIYKIEQNNYRAKLQCKQFIPWAQFIPDNNKQMITIKFGISEIANDTCVGQYDELNDKYYSFQKHHALIINQEIQDDQSSNNQLYFDQSADEDFPKDKITYYNKLNSRSNQRYTILFSGFDIPYYKKETFFDELNIQQESSSAQINYASMTIQSDLELEMQFCKQKYLLNDSEIKRIQKIHQNIQLSINETGQIFLINKSSNKLYFFYQDKNQKYMLHKMAIKDYKISGADSSNNILLIWGKQNYQLFDITILMNDQQNSKSKSSTINLQALPVEDSFQNNLIIKQTNEAQFPINQNIEEYIFEITECKLLNNWVILKINEDQDFQQVNYLKIFDFRTQTIVQYLEYDQLMLSGNKEFIWLPLQDKVYDIYNNFSTLFLWPGGQINTAGIDEMDVFNISQDRSIMITHGKLNLAFDMISACIQPQEINSENDDLQQQEGLQKAKTQTNISQAKSLAKVNINMNKIIQAAIEPSEKDFRSRYLYLMYNLPNKLSLISKIISLKENARVKQQENPNKSQAAKSTNARVKQQENPNKSQAAKSTKNEEVQVQMENLFLTLVNYLNKNSNNSPEVIQNCAEFILSFQIDTNLFKQKQGAESPINSKINIIQLLFLPKIPRKDVIEEIMNFIVQSKMLIAQNIIFNSFIDLLKNADTSKAFQQYLEKGIIQTSKMQSTGKYSIQQTEQKYILDAYISPIMDEGFHQKFQNGQSKIDVRIQYIFIGDLLEKKGQEIFDTLKDEKFIQLMSIPFIKYLVEYQWKSVKSPIVQKTLYPFYILLLTYSIYSLIFVSYIDKYQSIGTDTPFGFTLLYCSFVLIQIITVAYLFMIEFIQFWKEKEEYLSFWNIADLISISLVIIVICLDIFYSETKYLLRPIASITLIILWIKLFYFLRVYDQTSHLIRMIIQIITKIKFFLYILLIGVIAFAGGFFIMQFALLKTPDDPDETNEVLSDLTLAPKKFVGNNPLLAMTYSYRIAMGDFSLDEFQSFSNLGEFIVIWVIFIVGSFFLVIVLMNLLIAIMGNTYQNVQDNIQNLTIRENVLLVSENEAMFDRKERFNKSQYLIIISEGKTEAASLQQTVDTLLSTMKEEIFSKVNNLDTGFKAQLTETQKELKRKFQDQEEKQKISFGDLKTNTNDTNAKVIDQISQMRAQIDQLRQENISLRSNIINKGVKDEKEQVVEEEEPINDMLLYLQKKRGATRKISVMSKQI